MKTEVVYILMILIVSDEPPEKFSSQSSDVFFSEIQKTKSEAWHRYVASYPPPPLGTYLLSFFGNGVEITGRRAFHQCRCLMLFFFDVNSLNEESVL
jgi:hypothetical protein